MTGLAKRVKSGRSVLAVQGVLLVFLSGCHHRQARAPLVLPPPTSVPLVEVPKPSDLPLVEETNPGLPAVPVAQSATKLKKTKKRAVKTSAPVVGSAVPSIAQPGKTQEAAETTKAEGGSEAIGALTVGGEQSPRALQEANDLIATNERRLGGLNADTTRTQADLVSKIRNFQRDAQQALTSGDAEGAKTLATKGKLLLDDLEKGGS